jgi:uncharacterized protein
MHHLALSYKSGRGVPQDYVAAHMWFNLAASRPSEITGSDPIDNLMRAIEESFRKQTETSREELARQMTREQVAEAQRLARGWKPVPGR